MFTHYFRVRKLNECLKSIYVSNVNSQKTFLKYFFKNRLSVCVHKAVKPISIIIKNF